MTASQITNVTYKTGPLFEHADILGYIVDRANRNQSQTQMTLSSYASLQVIIKSYFYSSVEHRARH